MLPDDTPLFHELMAEAVRQRRLAGALVSAVHADHDENHDGPIMWCLARACRVAWEAVRKAA